MKLTLRRRVVLLIVVALMAMTLTAGPVAADERPVVETFPVSGAGVNSCTGEVFTFEGTVHAVVHSTDDRSGGSHRVNNSVLKAEGVGLESGDEYTLHLVGANTDSFFTGGGTNEATSVATGTVMREGGSGEDDLVGSAVFHFTATGSGITVVVENLNAQCR